MRNNRRQLYIHPRVEVEKNSESQTTVTLYLGSTLIDYLLVLKCSTGNWYLFSSQDELPYLICGGYQHCINIAYMYFNMKYK